MATDSGAAGLAELNGRYGRMRLGAVVAVSALAARVLLVTGAFYFRRMEATFADVV